MKPTKEELLRTCHETLDAKIAFVTDRMNNFQSSANEEVKSSAGDKYETGRAMMHLEKEKLLSQLSELSLMKKTLLQVTTKKFETVQLGSLIETEREQLFFLSVGLGQIVIEQSTIFCISVKAPISQLFLSKSIGDSIVLNGVSHKIKGLV